METKIQPGYTVPAEEADYTAIVQELDTHNAAAQAGEHYWGVSYENGDYTVYVAGEVPPPPTAEELAAQEQAKKDAEEREKLPETVKALQSALDDADALNVDQEYRLTLLELGITDTDTSNT